MYLNIAEDSLNIPDGVSNAGNNPQGSFFESRISEYSEKSTITFSHGRFEISNAILIASARPAEEKYIKRYIRYWK